MTAVTLLATTLSISEWALVTVAIAAVVIVVLSIGAWNWSAARQKAEKDAELAGFIQAVNRSLRLILKQTAGRDKATRQFVSEVESRLRAEIVSNRDIILRDAIRNNVVNVSHTDLNGDRMNIGRVGDGDGNSQANDQ